MIPISRETPVNIHFLFDPTIVDQLEMRFFSQLRFEDGEKVYHPVRNDLIALGRTRLPDQADEKVLLKKGVELFVVSKDAIDAVMKRDPDLRNHVLIGVSNGSKDGLSGVGKGDIATIGSGSQMEAVVGSIFKMCDFIFSGKPSDVEYFLGKKHGDKCSKQDVVKRCGALMPCVMGSDAHSLETVFEPNLKRYCWIKADPTFNGLRQILYEPETRVRIQETQPERKEQYYVIEGVSFDGVVMDGSVAGTNLKGLFPNGFIPFNDHLNCIIGGKSTGKSLLLKNIANAIDPEQVARKCGKLKPGAKDSLFEGVTVRWRDGTQSKSSDTQHEHKIVYIPQTYLNRLSESENEVTDIDDIIKNIVLGRKECKDAFDEMKSALNSLKEKTDLAIYQLQVLYNDVNELTGQQKEIGTRAGIKKEIDDKEERRKEISTALSISEEDIKKYGDAEHEATELEGVIRRLTIEKETIEGIETIVQILDYSSLKLSDDTHKALDAAGSLAIRVANESWQKSKANLLSEILKRISEYQDQLKADKTIIESLAEQVKQSTELMELSASLQKQREKLAAFDGLDKIIKNKRNQIEDLQNQLAQTFDCYRSIHENFASTITGLENDLAKEDATSEEDLRFIVRSPFRRESFEEALRGKFNKTSLKSRSNIIDLDSVDEKDFTQEKIKNIIVSVMDGTLKLLSAISKEETLRAILSDWYNTTYNVEMDGDTIGFMSPGKKALVLLKMLIELEDSKCPILIDQPEDDLDNRSIYKELTPFILSKKVDRQIIIVTHNANVVLGSDAEEVVVANQHGKNTPNGNYRFEYVTGAIEHCKITCENEGALYQYSIQQHICDILEGGKEAFRQREQKYRMTATD